MFWFILGVAAGVPIGAFSHKWLAAKFATVVATAEATAQKAATPAAPIPPQAPPASKT